jgi:hypothetical protein
MSQRIKNAKRRHMVEMFTVMFGYLAIVFAATRLEDLFTNKIVLTVLALAPVLPMALACFVYIRVYRQMDEREKMINANAAGIALMIAVLAATALGFLQSFGVLVIEDVMIWFTSFLIIAWGAARFFMGEES